MTKSKGEILFKILEKYWDKQGSCRSCGWHGALLEHDPEIDDWISKEQAFEFYCVNPEAENHRSIFVYISDKDKKLLGLN